jgi:hypothetical protein
MGQIFSTTSERETVFEALKGPWETPSFIHQIRTQPGNLDEFYAEETFAQVGKQGVDRVEERRNFIMGMAEIIPRQVALCVFMKAITPTKLSVSSIPQPNSTKVGGITFIGSAPPSSCFAPEKLRRRKKPNWPDVKLSRTLLTQIARTLKVGLPLEFRLNG